MCINLKTNDVVFEWHAMDHIDLNEAVVPPTINTGAGISYGKAFDFFHINSVDGFGNGDFLISARHTDTLYRIDGNNGSVVWRLGGLKADFDLQGFNFSAQHDARIASEAYGPNRVILVNIFNNAYNGEIQTAEQSSAMQIEIDTVKLTARLNRQWLSLKGGLSQNQGSIQHMSKSGNTLISWGIVAEFSEIAPDGERVLDVAFVDKKTRNYRVRKDSWLGRPKSVPDLYLYARTAQSNTHFWMSWNGATEVKLWRMHSLGQDGSTRLLGSLENQDYESHFATDEFVGAGMVEAIGPEGEVLGKSEICQTFIPSAELEESCGEEHCTLQTLQAQDFSVSPKIPIETLRQGSGFGEAFGWLRLVMQAACFFSLGMFVGRSRRMF